MSTETSPRRQAFKNQKKRIGVIDSRFSHKKRLILRSSAHFSSNRQAVQNAWVNSSSVSQYFSPSKYRFSWGRVLTPAEELYSVPPQPWYLKLIRLFFGPTTLVSAVMTSTLSLNSRGRSRNSVR